MSQNQVGKAERMASCASHTLSNFLGSPVEDGIFSFGPCDFSFILKFYFSTENSKCGEAKGITALIPSPHTTRGHSQGP